ncbi:hypothetical protein TSHO111613_22620 [Tsukamurella hominis]
MLQGGDRRPGRRTRTGRCFTRTTGSIRSTASLVSRGAHEKGGVEGEVGWFRRNRLTPMPQVESLDELNEQIKAREDRDEGLADRRTTAHHRPGLPARPGCAGSAAGGGFRPWSGPHTVGGPVGDDHSSDGPLLGASASDRPPGPRLAAGLAAAGLRRPRLVARHQRVAGRGIAKVDLDHYLEVLKFKPGALPGAVSGGYALPCCHPDKPDYMRWASESAEAPPDPLMVRRGLDKAVASAMLTSSCGLFSVAERGPRSLPTIRSAVFSGSHLARAVMPRVGGVPAALLWIPSCTCSFGVVLLFEGDIEPLPIVHVG